MRTQLVHYFLEHLLPQTFILQCYKNHKSEFSMRKRLNATLCVLIQVCSNVLVRHEKSPKYNFRFFTQEPVIIDSISLMIGPTHRLGKSAINLLHSRYIVCFFDVLSLHIQPVESQLLSAKVDIPQFPFHICSIYIYYVLCSI